MKENIQPKVSRAIKNGFGHVEGENQYGKFPIPFINSPLSEEARKEGKAIIRAANGNQSSFFPRKQASFVPTKMNNRKRTSGRLVNVQVIVEADVIQKNGKYIPNPKAGQKKKVYHVKSATV